MDDWINKRLKEAVRIEYTLGEGLDVIAQRIGMKVEDLIRLNANENLFIPRSFLSELLKETADEVDMRTYPRLEERHLIEALSTYLKIPSSYLVVGNGSDPLIETIVTSFIRDSEQVISVSPTFGMYKVITMNHGYEYIDVPLNDDFSLDPDMLLAQVNNRTRLCFLASPNNPFGNQFEIASVKRIIEEFQGIVIIDEAYVHFAPYSFIDLIEDYDNLILLRTFSKAFGLAGLRVGYSIAQPEISSVLKKIQLPFNCNKLSLVIARRILGQSKIVNESVQQIIRERDKLFTDLKKITGVRPVPSDANFILFSTQKDPEKIYSDLQNRGILIRIYRNIVDQRTFLRVTVGPPEINQRFIEALTELCDVDCRTTI
jgi:histidinol-phosphate aminotransferase